MYLQFNIFKKVDSCERKDILMKEKKKKNKQQSDTKKKVKKIKK